VLTALTAARHSPSGSAEPETLFSAYGNRSASRSFRDRTEPAVEEVTAGSGFTGS
jgi:hypothetical protein